MIEREQVVEIIEGHLENTTLFLVDVVVRPGNTIIVEIDSDDAIGVDDCVELSRYVESKLDREVEDYELEVGSAGLTSPFKIPRQYQKNIGNEVEVLTKGGQKLSGVLESATENGFSIVVSKMVKPEGAKKKVAVEEELSFGYEDVKYTKYIIRFK